MSLLSSFISNVMGQTMSDSREIESSSLANLSLQGKDGSDSESCEAQQTCHEPLEWTFIDFSKATRSPIFDVDPIMLKRFIGHNVTVFSKSRQEFKGCCLAIDPVSLSVILAKRVAEGKIRIITVPGYYLAKIRVDPNSVPAENSVSVNDLDVAELYHAPSLYSESKSTENQRNKTDPDSDGRVEDKSRRNLQTGPEGSSSFTPEYSDDEILKRKEKLLELLAKHRMPVVVKGEILEIPGGVQITSPYTINCCHTGNQIIKKKIGELIKSI